MEGGQGEVRNVQGPRGRPAPSASAPIRRGRLRLDGDPLDETREHTREETQERTHQHPREDDTTLERLVIGVLDVRAPNDRGVLAGHVDRALDLTSGAAELTLPDAPPAVYGEVELFLGPGAWGPAMVFEIQEPSRHIVLELDRRVELEGRCDMPHELGTSGGLGMTVNVDIALIAHVLRESELPAPVDGVIHVDATSAPAVIAEILASFERLELECADYDL